MKTAQQKITAAFRKLKIDATTAFVGEELHIRFANQPAKVTTLLSRRDALTYAEALADIISARG